MKQWLAGALALAWVHGVAFTAYAEGKKRSDAQVRQILIAESIASYSGSCPCPYSTARNGSRCGRRSAYNREGGAAPLCYPKDVTAEMVQTWREAHPEEGADDGAARCHARRSGHPSHLDFDHAGEPNFALREQVIGNPARRCVHGDGVESALAH